MGGIQSFNVHSILFKYRTLSVSLICKIYLHSLERMGESSQFLFFVVVHTIIQTFTYRNHLTYAGGFNIFHCY